MTSRLSNREIDFRTNISAVHIYAKFFGGPLSYETIEEEG
jgi:hypothetical protein